MITADEIDAAFTYFRSRGAIHGDEAAAHAAAIQRWWADVWCALREKDAEVAAARRSVARADAVIAAVQDAIDGADSYADLVAALATALGIRSRRPPLEQPRRAPSPTRRTA